MLAPRTPLKLNPGNLRLTAATAAGLGVCLAILGPEKRGGWTKSKGLQTRFSENLCGECRKKGLFLMGLAYNPLFYRLSFKILCSIFCKSPINFDKCPANSAKSPITPFSRFPYISLSYFIDLKRKRYRERGLKLQNRIPSFFLFPNCIT